MTEADGPNTIRLSNTPRGLRAAVAMLREGQLVSFPTETVYGLGADATNDRAVAGIFAAKGRPRFNPLIVHVPDLAEVEAIASVPQVAADLAAAFWPGPLTMVLPLRADSGLADLVSAGLPTVAVRVPADPVAQALLRALGRPVAAPSANPSGKVSATTADHVMQGLSGRIAGVLDAGPTGVGLESTILAVEPEGAVTLLRPGGLPIEAVEAMIGPVPRDTTPHGPGDGVRAPGQLASHYAPDVALHLNAEVADAGALWLAFGPLKGRRGISLSETGDLVEAAANLFAALHDIDAVARDAGVRQVLVDPIPAHGLGIAINDRLSRAATPPA
ncbi:L-threonylcarbamoyladenylate synthase [Oceanibium sediminis]|uniref:L-threonylcarbamoyladenylate synthase n=1 Tax=Oceanibium sediminis TaxID=2026339 RepID=UPI000DD386EB|nr:L-threonylcarbamoyladenylate synthase [Oceanibium sediminis]